MTQKKHVTSRHRLAKTIPKSLQNSINIKSKKQNSKINIEMNNGERSTQIVKANTFSNLN